MATKNQRDAAWKKANADRVTVTLYHSTDADILDMFAKTNSKSGLIKAALREYRENHNSFRVAENKGGNRKQGKELSNDKYR